MILFWTGQGFMNTDAHVCVCLYPRRQPATNCMRSRFKRRWRRACTSSNLRMPTSKLAWTLSKTTWSTLRQKSSRPRVVGHTNSKNCWKGNWDSSEYIDGKCVCYRLTVKRRAYLNNIPNAHANRSQYCCRALTLKVHHCIFKVEK